jgi:hypothetical protein
VRISELICLRWQAKFLNFRNYQFGAALEEDFTSARLPER